MLNSPPAVELQQLGPQLIQQSPFLQLAPAIYLALRAGSSQVLHPPSYNAGVTSVNKALYFPNFSLCFPATLPFEPEAHSVCEEPCLFATIKCWYNISLRLGCS